MAAWTSYHILYGVVVLFVVVQGVLPLTSCQQPTSWQTCTGSLSSCCPSVAYRTATSTTYSTCCLSKSRLAWRYCSNAYGKVFCDMGSIYCCSAATSTFTRGMMRYYRGCCAPNKSSFSTCSPGPSSTQYCHSPNTWCCHYQTFHYGNSAKTIYDSCCNSENFFHPYRYYCMNNNGKNYCPISSHSCCSRGLYTSGTYRGTCCVGKPGNMTSGGYRGGSRGGPNMGTIIGCITGILVVLVVIGVVVGVICVRQRNRRSNRHTNNGIVMTTGASGHNPQQQMIFVPPPPGQTVGYGPLPGPEPPGYTPPYPGPPPPPGPAPPGGDTTGVAGAPVVDMGPPGAPQPSAPPGSGPHAYDNASFA